MTTPDDEDDSRQLKFDYDPLQVNLPEFDGPLDLLLHLVRKQELDINQLRLADLTEPYLAHVEHMKQLNLDIAGEFLSIAATLIWIKSKTLLPSDTEEEDELDPETLEEMLLLRLQEYQRFKEASLQLTELDLLGRDVFPRNPPLEEEEEKPSDAPEFEEVSLFGLLEAFRSVLDRASAFTELNILPEREKVEDRIGSVLDLLHKKRAVYFHEFFTNSQDRGEIVLTFIAILELARLNALRVSQAESLGPIYCEVTESFQSGGGSYKRLILQGIYGDKYADDESKEEGNAEGKAEEAKSGEKPDTTQKNDSVV